MITQPRSRLAVVQPHGPDAQLIPGLTASTRLTSAQTGSISIVEHVFSPGTLVPPHTHTLEDEISYVVAGDIGLRSNGKDGLLGPAGLVGDHLASYAAPRLALAKRQRRVHRG